MTFADKLIRLRKINGMSQEDLAEELGVSRQAISKWEGMLSVPDLQNVLKISELFNVTTDYLLKDNIGDDRKIAATPQEVCGGAAEASFEERAEAVPDGPCADVCAVRAADVQTKQAGIADKNTYAEGRDKNFAIAAGVLLLFAPLLEVIMLSVANSVSGAEIMLLLVISIAALGVVSGVLTILSIMNRKLLGIAFCLILIKCVASVILTILQSIGNMVLLFNLIGDGLALLYSMLAVIKFYSKGRVNVNTRILLILPSICAMAGLLVSVFSYDYSGDKARTLPFGCGYVAYLLMAAILFREDGYKRKRSENLGLAGVALISLSAALSIFYLFVAIFAGGEVLAAIYVYGYVILYAMGFVLLPWIACYTSKKPLGSIKLKRGYFGMSKHVLMTALLSLVWHYIWVYRTSEYLDCPDGRKGRAVGHMLLYVFIPFYYIMWFYKHGQVISERETAAGEEIGKLNKGMTAFAAFMPFVGSVIMQNRINALVLAGDAESEKKD